MPELIKQFELTGSTITLTTPDTCVICKRPATERYKVSEVRRYHATISHKTGRLSWRVNGWKDVTARLCDQHAAQVRNTYETPTPAVTPAKVRMANYQAAQMDAGQLSYWNQEQWYVLHTTQERDKLSKAIERHTAIGQHQQELPLLTDWTAESKRSIDRLAQAHMKYEGAWWKREHCASFVHVRPTVTVRARIRTLMWQRSLAPRRQANTQRIGWSSQAWGTYCRVGTIILPDTLHPEPLPVWATMPDPLAQPIEKG